jgi:hypothetical protein
LLHGCAIILVCVVYVGSSLYQNLEDFERACWVLCCIQKCCPFISALPPHIDPHIHGQHPNDVGTGRPSLDQVLHEDVASLFIDARNDLFLFEKLLESFLSLSRVDVTEHSFFYVYFDHCFIKFEILGATVLHCWRQTHCFVARRCLAEARGCTCR